MGPFHTLLSRGRRDALREGAIRADLLNGHRSAAGELCCYTVHSIQIKVMVWA